MGRLAPVILRSISMVLVGRSLCKLLQELKTAQFFHFFIKLILRLALSGLERSEQHRGSLAGCRREVCLIEEQLALKANQ